jgi:hypothetical protein
VLHLRAPIADEGLHRCRRQVELGGDVCLATSLDKESAEHFVATLKQLGGFEKETAAGVIVVHGRSSGSKVTFRSVAQLKLQLRWKDAQLPTRTKTAKSLGKLGSMVRDRQLWKSGEVDSRTDGPKNLPCSAEQKGGCLPEKQPPTSRHGRVTWVLRKSAIKARVRPILSATTPNSIPPAADVSSETVASTKRFIGPKRLTMTRYGP